LMPSMPLTACCIGPRAFLERASACSRVLVPGGSPTAGLAPGGMPAGAACRRGNPQQEAARPCGQCDPSGSHASVAAASAAASPLRFGNDARCSDEAWSSEAVRASDEARLLNSPGFVVVLSRSLGFGAACARSDDVARLNSARAVARRNGGDVARLNSPPPSLESLSCLAIRLNCRATCLFIWASRRRMRASESSSCFWMAIPETQLLGSMPAEMCTKRKHASRRVPSGLRRWNTRYPGRRVPVG